MSRSIADHQATTNLWEGLNIIWIATVDLNASSYNLSVVKYSRVGQSFPKEVKEDMAMMFISLLSPKGKGKEAINYLNNLKPTEGIKIHNIFLTLGRYDLVIVFEVTDVGKAMNFAIQTGEATDYAIETLSAIPIEKLELKSKF